ncbi:MAG: tetratricopeptide repeat protein [Candidatus Zixiibacteriota bacterium]
MKRIALTIIALLPLVFGGCASKAVKRQMREVKVEPLGLRAEPLKLLPEEGKLDPRAYYYFINAVLYEQMGNPYLAAMNYNKAWKHYPESYEIGFSLALNLYRLQRYEEALEALNRIGRKDAAVHDLRGAIFRATGADDSARAAYLEVIRTDSMNSNAFALLAGAYRRLDDLDSTIWAYRNMVRIRPDHYQLWTELARLQAQTGDYEGARSSFQNSIEQEPGAANLQSYLGLAHSLELLQQVDSAICVLNAAVELDDSNVLIHRALRSLYISRDSLQAALPHAKREVELTPLDREVVRRLGMLYYWIDSLKQADSILSYLVENGDRHPTNYSYLGRIALRGEDPERARDHFISLTQVADSVSESWLDLGFVYRQLNLPDKEIETYRAGLSHMRDDAGRLHLLFALGAAYERHGHIDSAVTTFEEVIARDPDYHQALNYLGYMLADRGERLEYARDLIQRAIELSPGNAAYLDSYGWVSYRLGDYRQALKHLEKAVSLDSDPVIFDHLGDTYNALGKKQQARTWWEKALGLDPDNRQIKDKLGLQ